MDSDALLDDLGRLPDPLPEALRYWTKIKGERRMPRRCDFDPVDVPRLLPHVILTEVLRTGDERRFEDYRFRVIGTYIDERLRRRYTGRRLSELDGKGPGSKVWAAYGDVRAEMAPMVRSLDYVGPMENLKQTRELYLPLSDSDQRVDFVVVVLVFE